jgi:hypothetical protein
MALEEDYSAQLRIRFSSQPPAEATLVDYNSTMTILKVALIGQLRQVVYIRL